LKDPSGRPGSRADSPRAIAAEALAALVVLDPEKAHARSVAMLPAGGPPAVVAIRVAVPATRRRRAGGCAFV
jgi:hypothetical protein